MGLYLNQRENRSELQQRLDAELREKARARAQREHDTPDGVDDSAYIQGTKQTTTLDWVWLVIGVVVIGIVGYFIYLTVQ